VFSMLVFWLSRVNSTFQACMQNFSGGLASYSIASSRTFSPPLISPIGIIIAAVGGELFPLIIDGPGKTIPSQRELGQ